MAPLETVEELWLGLRPQRLGLNVGSNNLPAIDDGSYDRNLSLTALKFGHIGLKEFGEDFAPARVFNGGVLWTIIFGCSFPFFLALELFFLRLGEPGAKTPLHLTR